MNNSVRSQTLIFLHIPKTGGITLNIILQHQYGSQRVYELTEHDPQAIFDKIARLSDEQRTRYAVISGHLQFGLHVLLPQPGYYFTLLRDPIDRVLSLYFFLRQTANHPLYSQVVDQNLSLEQFIEQPITNELDNYAVRTLAGAVALPFGQCTPDLLETAKQNLQQHFRLAGLTERFDETVVLLRRAFSWRTPFYQRLNITVSRKAKDEIEPRLIQRIAALNEFDIQLYQYAQAQFDQQIFQQGPSFQRELRRFRRLNSYYNWIYPQLWPARKVKHSLLKTLRSNQS